MLLLQFVGWLVFSCILMSFIEHQVHSKLMHKRNYLSSRVRPFKRMLESHAVLHHGTYKIIFRDEPLPPGEDKGIRLNIIEGELEMLPFIIIIGLISPLGGATFAGVVALHHFLWNQIHLEMHKPEDRIFGKWPVYKLLARHHLLHHRYPHRNFNVVFPFADFVLGTNAKSKYSDHAEMYRLGLLKRGGEAKLPTIPAENKPTVVAIEAEKK